VRQIKTVLVGAGLEALGRHVRIMQKSPMYDLIGLVDNRKEAIQHASRHYSGKTVVADTLNDVPWLKDADAVIVSTSLKSHYSIIKEALLAGLHVLTEKPFVETVAQGEELIKMAHSQKRQLAIVHNWLFASAVQRMRRDLHANRYGTIHALTLHNLNNPNRPVPAWHEQLPFGQLYDESPHCLYLLRDLSPGPMVWKNRSIIEGLLNKGNTPAQLSADFVAQTDSDNEIPIHLYFNFDSPVCEWRLMVYGEKGLGTVDMFRNIYTFTKNDGNHGFLSLVRSAGTFFMQHWLQHLTLGARYMTGTFDLGHAQVFDHFAKALLGEETLKGMSGEDALDVLRLQHEMLGIGPEVSTN